jgi:hypothetical protein
VEGVAYGGGGAIKHCNVAVKQLRKACERRIYTKINAILVSSSHHLFYT